MELMGDCQKCGSKWQSLFFYNDMMFGKSCGCFEEEQEKNDGKIQSDLDYLDDYKKLISGTKGITPSSY